MQNNSDEFSPALMSNLILVYFDTLPLIEFPAIRVHKVLVIRNVRVTDKTQQRSFRTAFKQEFNNKE